MLNALQKEIILKNVTRTLDLILTSSLDFSLKFDCLQKVIAPLPSGDLLSLSKTKMECLERFSEHPGLPSGVRKLWASLLHHLSNKEAIPDALWKQLREINHYNPLYVLALEDFEQAMGAAPNLVDIKTNLKALRALFLEVIPILHSATPAADRAFSLQLEFIPLLEHYGPRPALGEVQAELRTLILERIHDHEEQSREIAMTPSVASPASEEKREGVDPRIERAVDVLLKEMLGERAALLFKAVPPKLPKHPFLQVQRDLNNRLTEEIQAIQISMVELDNTLKSSTTYLKLRVAEFYYELLQIQLESLQACVLTFDIDKETINRQYQTQLDTAYKHYLEDMCTKWMAERQGHTSSAAELSRLTEQFKNAFEREMRPYWTKLKKQTIESRAAVTAIRALELEIEQADVSRARLKETWDKQIFPLVDLASKCQDMRGLRRKIQAGRIEAFNEVILNLWKLSPEHASRVDTAGYSLIHYGCLLGAMPVVRECLTRVTGDILSLRTREGDTLLHLACIVRNEQTPTLLELLLKFALEAKAGRTPAEVLSVTNRRGKTLLHIMAAKNNVPAATWLAAKQPLGVLVDVRDSDECTPLHYAARDDSLEMAEFLLNQGANARALNRSKHSPVLLAVQKGHLPLVHLFFRFGFWLSQADIRFCLQIPIHGLSFLKSPSQAQVGNAISTLSSPSAAGSTEAVVRSEQDEETKGERKVALESESKRATP